MAEVYKAKSYGVAGFEKLLVIKKILPHLSSDREFIEMFKDEAQISASLSHGNIVQVIDFGKEGDSYFMAMEYVNGFDLSRVIMKGRQVGDELTQPQCLFILCEVLKALDYAHRRRNRQQKDLNIVHCDVSPQNVLLSFEGEVKLTDFGISKAAFQSASSQGVVRGKYAYMSPEQVEGRPLDRRSDIFSVGIILWELLTNRRLFKTDNVEKTLRKVLHGPIPAPSELVPGLHPELDRITLKALARDRDLRYLDDQELLEDLSAFMFTQAMHLTSTELGEFLRRVYAQELLKGREDELGPPAFLAPLAEGERRERRTLFIPVGSGRTIPSHQPDSEGGPSLPLCRIGVAVLCAEWHYTPAVPRSSSERSRLMRELIERFERRIEGSGGELWEVNHNSLIACWRLEEDPSGSMNLALECAFGLQEEQAAALGTEAAACVLDVGLHAGAVVTEKRSGNPLFGWQITRTFGLPRLMVNLNSGRGLVLITDRGQQLVADRFGFQEHPLPGRADSYLPDVYEVVGPASGQGRARAKFSPYTRYLGREGMLASLVDRLRQASEGRASVVLVLGDEGMGKSRLREELRQSCRKLGVSFFLGISQKEMRHFAYSTFLDALRRICGLSPPETLESERHKLSRLNQLGLSQEELAMVLSLFEEPAAAYQRGLDPNRPGAMFALFDKLLAGLAKDAPLVLGFEEFQWADVLTEDYVAHLVSHPGNRRLVLLLEVPADYQRPWLNGAPVSHLRLEGMPGPLVEEMIKDMLGALEVAPDLVQTVHSCTGGNPLLVKELLSLMVDEEYLRVERRSARLSIPTNHPVLPESGLELLARRFARVPLEARALLKAGAMLGPQFPLLSLEQLMPGCPDARELFQKVAALGILKERQLEHVTYYRFRHSRYRTLAAGLLVAPSSRELNRRLAAGLGSWVPFGRGNQIEWLATSCWRSSSPEAAGALELAGDKLFFEHGFASSLVYYRRAFETLGADYPGSEGHRHRLRQKIARTLMHQSVTDASGSLLQEGLSSARRAGAEQQAAELLIELSRQHMSRGEIERAIQVLREALALAHRTEGQALIAEVERELGGVLQSNGEVDDAIHYLRSAYQRAKLEGDKAVILGYALAIASFHHQVGDFTRALESYRKVLVAARELGDRSQMRAVLVLLGDLHFDLGREELAARCYKEALNLARLIEDGSAQAVILGRIGDLCLEGGAPQRAYPYLKAALEMSITLSRSELITCQRLSLAFVKGLASDPRTGLREIQTVMARPETGLLRPVVARAHLLVGRCQIQLRENRRAREAFERSLAVAREIKSAPLTRRALAALGGLPMTVVGIPVSTSGGASGRDSNTSTVK